MHDKADPNTLLRIAVSFILYKARLKVSVQGISDGVACHNSCERLNLVIVWFKVALPKCISSHCPCRQITNPHNQFSDQNSVTKGRGSPTFLVPTFRSRRLCSLTQHGTASSQQPDHQSCCHRSTLLIRRHHRVFRDLFHNLNRAIQISISHFL